MQPAVDRPFFRAVGLDLTFSHGTRSVLIALACGAGFGVWMALADATLFYRAVPEVQHLLLSQLTVGQRLARFVPGAIVDEIEYRLVALTAIASLLVVTSGRRGAAVYWLSILLTAFVVYPIGAWAYFRDLHYDGLTVAREVALHGAGGTLWGWLYWRHGWMAGVTGHVAAHLALQPLLGFLA